MKSVLRYLLVGCLVAGLGGIVVIASQSNQARAAAGRASDPLPASLDNYFPPRAQGPVFLMKMAEMSSALSGIVINAQEKDTANLTAHFERFRSLYSDISHFVPEWTSSFPMEPVEDLGKAVKNRDEAALFPALERLGAVCKQCHVANMSRVQHAYHWEDIRQLTVTDPVSGGDIPFPVFKHMLATSFDGIGISLQEGQPEAAARHYADFERRFGALSEVCGACHSTPRAYYVDETVQSSIRRLGEALRRQPPDPQVIQGLSMNIGMESCHKCHLVHVPAAMFKAANER